MDPTEAPDTYIYDLHKSAMKSATSPAERLEISEALKLIGRARKSEAMQKMAENGQTMLSVAEAYAALSAPNDSIDEGLIM